MTVDAESSIQVNSNHEIKHQVINLSSSKSESNRALMINALSGNLGKIRNLSDARDTVTMARLLKTDDEVLDVIDAGTTMRFLTSYFAVAGRNKKTLTGSSRMQERPIKILVDALNAIGAEISYLKNDGYPPIKILPFSQQKINHIKIPANISSQYISALLMIAPVLPKGLTVELEGEIYSQPYIRMTLALMQKFGVKHQWQGQAIKVDPQTYNGAEYTIESDWSGASYWYGFLSLAKKGSLQLTGLRKDSYQGDRTISDMMEKLGVKTQFNEDGVLLVKGESIESCEIDFRACPDLAMTVIVSTSAQKIGLRMTGLESLKIKESDRIAALKNELAKVNVDLIETNGNSWELRPEKFQLKAGTVFETYDDHRMAMALAPLGMIAPIEIMDPGVVEKSYPNFWHHVRNATS